jgi:hypothetical protein
MLETLLGSYYGVYVVVLQVLISLFVVLSTLVSLDRVLCIAKYLFTKAKSLVTGKLPQHAWNFRPLPNDPANYPSVAIQLPYVLVCPSSRPCFLSRGPHTHMF